MFGSLLITSCAAVPIANAATTSRLDEVTFGASVRLPASNGSTEPRIAATPGRGPFVVSGIGTFAQGTYRYPVTVYQPTHAGGAWVATGRSPSPPSADVDIVATRTGRLIVATLGGHDAIAMVSVTYSDDGGRTWTNSSGLASLADQDRPWLAVGPDDRTTHQPRVYLLFHGLLSSNLTQNLFLATSTDGGANFGPPIPLLAPGSEAWLDLQCGASPGPGALLVNPRSGRLYAVWAARHGPTGGCGNTPVQPWTLVASNRIWAATSATGEVNSWRTSLAVDDSSKGHAIGTQLPAGALDAEGDLYVAYPESPHAFPDYAGARITVRETSGDLGRWSTPVRLGVPSKTGDLLPEIVAGDAGRFAVAYVHGIDARHGESSLWYPTVSVVIPQGAGRPPHVTAVRLSPVPAFKGSASQLLGLCGHNPTPDFNPLLCNRVSDNWGVTVDGSCRIIVGWASLAAAADPTVGASVDATWVVTQRSGVQICRGR